MEAVGLLGRLLPVAVDERLELSGMAVALLREVSTGVEHVDLVGVPLGHLAERARQVHLGAMKEAEVVRELHRLRLPPAPARRRTARETGRPRRAAGPRGRRRP